MQRLTHRQHPSASWCCLLQNGTGKASDTTERNTVYVQRFDTIAPWVTIRTTAGLPRCNLHGSRRHSSNQGRPHLTLATCLTRAYLSAYSWLCMTGAPLTAWAPCVGG